MTATGLKDRNEGHPGKIKREKFGVLNRDYHSSNTAAVLLEVSFMDMAAEEQRLTTVAYKNRIANGIADGIEDYLGVGAEMAEGEEEFGDAIEATAYKEGWTAAELLGVDGGAIQLSGDRIIEETQAAGPGARPSAHDLESTKRRQRLRELVGGSSLDGDPALLDSGEFADLEVLDPPDFNAIARGDEEAFNALDASFLESDLERFDAGDFNKYVKSLGLRHFAAAEFLFLGSSNSSGRCRGKNSLPPRDLWEHIASTARMLDEIRERLGASVRILSCYRNRSYNTCIGGASKSMHMEFNAIDWRCSKGRPRDWAAVAREVRRSSPEYHGGIGVYNSFVHIDTGVRIGRRRGNVDW